MQTFSSLRGMSNRYKSIPLPTISLTASKPYLADSLYIILLNAKWKEEILTCQLLVWMMKSKVKRLWLRMTSNDSSNRSPMDRDGSNIGKKSNSPAKRSKYSTIFMRMWLSMIMETTTIRQRKSWKAKMRSFEHIGRLLEERKSTTRCNEKLSAISLYGCGKSANLWKGWIHLHVGE